MGARPHDHPNPRKHQHLTHNGRCPRHGLWSLNGFGGQDLYWFVNYVALNLSQTSLDPCPAALLFNLDAPTSFGLS